MGGRSATGQQYAFFEAFPASGAGASGPCSTTAPTGARGEALTFARTGNATCTKTASGGLATTGIADGDLVVLSANQPRVEYDSAGVLGLRVEGARTNGVPQSESLDNAAWSNVASGVAAPTLNGACATSPIASPGSMPEDYTFAATTTGQASGRKMSTYATCTGAVCSSSIFIKGVSGGGTIDLCVYGGAVGQCQPCSFVDTSWTRCIYNGHNSAGLAEFVVGNSTQWNGGTSRIAARVCLTGAQMELGAYATSYIPTVAASATRNADLASFDLGASAPGTNSFSAALSKQGESDLTSPSGSAWLMANPVSAVDGSGKGLLMYGPSNFQRCLTANDAATQFSTGIIAGTANATPQRWSCWGDGNARGIYKGTSLTASAAQTGTFSPARYVTIGNASLAASAISSGIYTLICLDPSPTRCR